MDESNTQGEVKEGGVSCKNLGSRCWLPIGFRGCNFLLGWCGLLRGRPRRFDGCGLRLLPSTFLRLRCSERRVRLVEEIDVAFAWDVGVSGQDEPKGELVSFSSGSVARVQDRTSSAV